jgi:hypothetical protein
MKPDTSFVLKSGHFHLLTTLPDSPGALAISGIGKTLGQVAVAFGLAAFVIVLVLNAAFMLVSPRAWFGLPAWIRLKGSLTKGAYGSGWGALQVRLLGAIVLLGFAFVFSHMLGLKLEDGGQAIIPVLTFIALSLSMYSFAAGAFMLASPRTWSRLPPWIRYWPQGESRFSALHVRIIGASMMAVCAWIFYSCFSEESSSHWSSERITVNPDVA